MRKLNSFFAIILSVLVIATVITGCGHKSNDMASSQASEDYHGEGEIQGRIKSDEEIAVLNEESAPTNEEPTYDNMSHETESYGSGNLQDYWQSDSYFDLAGYLKANGAENVYGTDGESYNKTDSNIKAFIATFYGNQWEIAIMCNTGVILSHSYIDGDSMLRKNPQYIIPCSPDDFGGSVIVDKQGTTARIGVINLMDTVMQYMKANPNSDDPLKGSGMFYFNQPL